MVRVLKQLILIILTLCNILNPAASKIGPQMAGVKLMLNRIVD